MSLIGRFLIWAAVAFVLGVTTRNPALGFGESFLTYLLIVMPYFATVRRVRRFSLRDPHGHVAACLGIAWMWSQDRDVLEVQVVGTRRECREFRAHLKKIAREGEA